MRYTIILAFFFCINFSWAQKSMQPLLAGFKLDLGYNFYQWQERGIGVEKRAYGQAFNILPSVGGGFWLGKKHWNLSLEGHIDYAPFAFDVQEYNGTGSVALPVLIKASYISKGKGGGWLFRGGAGVQWQSAGWYFRNKNIGKQALYFDRSYMLEISGGGIVGDFRRSHAWSLELFARVGTNPELQWGVYTGLRLAYWDTFKKYNPTKKKI